MKRVGTVIPPALRIDRTLPQALHKQIYDAYRAAITAGSLRPGERVASTRLLAEELGVSRFPVLNAYAQLLAEGYFESAVGSGTVICTSLPEQFTVIGNSAASKISKSSSSKETVKTRVGVRSGVRRAAVRTTYLKPLERSPWLRGSGAFSVGQVAFDQFPLQVWSGLVARHCRRMSARLFNYGDAMGLMGLREEIAGYLRTARAVRCEAEQVLIVAGSQQALEISARVLLDPRDAVWVEEPGYRFGRDVFALAGCRLVPVPVDREGLDVAEGMRRARRARAAVVSPSHQFPLGMTMSAQRRLQLLNWAHRSGAWVIEDDYDSEFRYDSAPIASLQGLDVNGRVIYIGTFSKVLYPAVRLGYMVAPTDLVERFLMVRRAMDGSPPSFYQEVLKDFIAEGHFARHIRRMRMVYGERRSLLAECLEKELGGMATVTGSDAGMYLSVTLPRGMDDGAIARRAAEAGLWAWPLSTAYLDGDKLPGFILGFGSTAVGDIPRAVRKLRGLMEAK